MNKHIIFYLVLIGNLAFGTKLKGGYADLCHPAVIAHRGASGYVPEHTLGAYALAVTMGADYVEPDLVMTKDGHLIARHENALHFTTNVANHSEFSHRYRTQSVDGIEVSGWFSEDFALDEIKTLRAKEAIPIVRPGNSRMDEALEIPSFQEIIDLVKSLEVSQGRTIGIIPEIKHSTHFQRLGLAMERPLIDIFKRNGYEGTKAPVYIQSFEINNLKEMKNLTDLRLVQLIGNSARQPFDQAELGNSITFGDMVSAEGLKEISKYAAAVGPDKSHIIPRTADGELSESTYFVRDAHNVGLKVYPYTFRSENVYLPTNFQIDDHSLSAIGYAEGEVEAFLATGIDGLFSDQPDVPLKVRRVCNRYPHNNANVSIPSTFYAIFIYYISTYLYSI